MTGAENPTRIEPCLLEQLPTEIADLISEVGTSATALGHRLHPRTAQSLCHLVSMMNCYYSNLIEGHHTRPSDIEKALANDLDTDPLRRDMQVEALSHIRVQAGIDRAYAQGTLPDPVSIDFVQRLHRDFYREAPESALQLHPPGGLPFVMVAGEFRSRDEHDIAVGRHQPPTSNSVMRFMEYFQGRYRGEALGPGMKILAMAAAHHRFNYIHPFPDGNGRVSRLMSHAMALKAGIGAHGLWSISRGLARGLSDRSDYMRMMDRADAARQSDVDGRGNLSLLALTEFVAWFLRVALDQIQFMQRIFDFDQMALRLERYVGDGLGLNERCGHVVVEILRRGSMPRGEVTRQLAASERRGRELLSQIVGSRLLVSDTPKGDVHLNFTEACREDVFPNLLPVGH